MLSSHTLVPRIITEVWSSSCVTQGTLGALACDMAMTPVYSAGVKGRGSHKNTVVNSYAALAASPYREPDRQRG